MVHPGLLEVYSLGVAVIMTNMNSIHHPYTHKLWEGWESRRPRVRSTPECRSLGTDRLTDRETDCTVSDSVPLQVSLESDRQTDSQTERHPDSLTWVTVHLLVTDCQIDSQTD